MNTTENSMRNRRRKIQRQTVRSVRNTLIVIALIAICWYVYLISQDSREKNRNRKPEQPTISAVKDDAQSPAIPTVEPAVTEEKSSDDKK